MRNHGTNSAYSSGCRCRPCTDAHAAYDRDRRRDAVYGVERRIDATPYAAWLVEHTLPALTLRDVEARTGVLYETLRDIRNGTTGTIRRSTAEALDRWIGGQAAS